MRNVFVVILCLSVLILPVSVSAQSGYLPDPGILPGNPLYIAKRALEGLGGMFTIGANREALRHVTLSMKRLSEIEALLVAERHETALRTYRTYFDELEIIKRLLRRVNGEDESDILTQYDSVLGAQLHAIGTMQSGESSDDVNRVHLRAHEVLFNLLDPLLRRLGNENPRYAMERIRSHMETTITEGRQLSEKDARDISPTLNRFHSVLSWIGREGTDRKDRYISTLETYLSFLNQFGADEHISVIEDERTRTYTALINAISDQVSNDEKNAIDYFISISHSLWEDAELGGDFDRLDEKALSEAVGYLLYGNQLLSRASLQSDRGADIADQLIALFEEKMGALYAVTTNSGGKRKEILENHLIRLEIQRRAFRTYLTHIGREDLFASNFSLGEDLIDKAARAQEDDSLRDTMRIDKPLPQVSIPFPTVEPVVQRQKTKPNAKLLNPTISILPEKEIKKERDTHKTVESIAPDGFHVEALHRIAPRGNPTTIGTELGGIQ
jgi:hypothetical protein